ncbi:exported hypothetical protein [Agrobacterium salinitolerans str. Hayward 0363]|uniref:Cyclase family protein n=1 Tax=Agrobacterium tumefaciens TaxID=358 RepID=A0AAF0K973_AGRTU|nr:MULTISPECIES: cyclase family protein [Agrobacterium]WGM60683.1 cyclase family protein [Agrobacterium tumefaciens]CVI62209.1 exported hypothetical protein [Agrobacterium salinitolerans str. Hayward 0363]
MCNNCVIENVKKNMLSRRLLFKGAAAGLTAMTASSLASPALAQSPRQVVDLTHTYDSAFPTFDGKPGIEYEWAAQIAKDGYQLHKLTIYEHTGTHIDAPFHFSADGASVDQLEPQKLVAPLVIVDITDRAKEDAIPPLKPKTSSAGYPRMATSRQVQSWLYAPAGQPK